MGEVVLLVLRVLLMPLLPLPLLLSMRLSLTCGGRAIAACS